MIDHAAKTTSSDYDYCLPISEDSRLRPLVRRFFDELSKIWPVSHPAHATVIWQSREQYSIMLSVTNGNRIEFQSGDFQKKITVSATSPPQRKKFVTKSAHEID